MNRRLPWMGPLVERVVELLRRLARDQSCAVLMVTHDPRILDVADRLLRMEDGCLLPAEQ